MTTLFVALSTITISIDASNLAITISIDASNLAITISIDASNLVVARISSNFVIKNEVIVHNNYSKIKFVIKKFSFL